MLRGWQQTNQKYDSLTAMMQTLANCCEIDTFEWTSDGNIYKDSNIIEECYLRYTPINQSMRSIAESNPLLL